MQLEIVAGAYNFELPTSFYPDYVRHGVSADAYNYGFNYEFAVSAQNKIEKVSIPSQAEISEQVDSGKYIKVNGA